MLDETSSLIDLNWVARSLPYQYDLRDHPKRRRAFWWETSRQQKGML